MHEWLTRQAFIPRLQLQMADIARVAMFQHHPMTNAQSATESAMPNRVESVCQVQWC